MENELPQYYMVKNQDNHLWSKYMDYLKNKSCRFAAFDGTALYYGFDGQYTYYGNAKHFNNNAKIITLEYWDSCVNPKPETNIPDGCEPFNLERCIAGDEVVTRDGRPFLYGSYNPNGIEQEKIVGWIDNVVTSFTEKGTVYVGKINNDDLFMKKKDVVTVSFRGCYEAQMSHLVSATLEGAIKAFSQNDGIKSISKFTITNGILTTETVHTF